MRIEVRRKMNEYYTINYEEGNTKIESGLLNDKEYAEEITDMLSELLYYAPSEVFKYLVENYKGEIEDVFEEQGFIITKEEESVESE